MSRRDRALSIGRRLLGALRGGSAPDTPAPAAPAPRPRAEPAATPAPTADDGLVRVGDLWAVRAALEPNGKVLVVNHWATWCDGCVEELEALVRLHATWGARAPFVGISWERFQGHADRDAAVAAVRGALAEHGLRWPQIVFDGEPDDLFRGLELEDHVIPQTFVLHGEGEIAWRHTGPLGAGEVAGLEQALKKLV